MRIKVKKQSRIVSISDLAGMMEIPFDMDDLVNTTDNLYDKGGHVMSTVAQNCEDGLFLDILEHAENGCGVTKKGIPFEIEELGDVPDCRVCGCVMRKVRNHDGLYICKKCGYYERTETFDDMISGCDYNYDEETGEPIEDEFIEDWMRELAFQDNLEDPYADCPENYPDD